MFPHTLSARPLVINGDSTIRLRFSHRCSDLEISCDSQIALPIQMAKMSSSAAAITTSI